MRVVAAQNHAAAWAAQGFVGGGGHEVAEWDGVGIFAAGNQTCVVRHIDKEVGTDFVGDFAECFCLIPLKFLQTGQKSLYVSFR